MVVEEAKFFGFGVMLWSMEGSRDFFGGAGVFGLAVLAGLGRGAEASDIGGEGGSCCSGATLAGGSESSSGGVEIRGELAVDCGEFSKVGDSGTEISVEMVDKCRWSAFFILSWRISASIFMSDNSSRNRWTSIRSFSRSCSPILISSSIMTDRSRATLYLDSISSSDDVVFLAWRSKSSFATSMSRNLSWSVRLESLRVVISFSNAFCCAFASLLAFRAFSYRINSLIFGAMGQSRSSILGILPSIRLHQAKAPRPFSAVHAPSCRQHRGPSPAPSLARD